MRSYSLLFILSFLTLSCNDMFEGINDDPNSLSNVSYEAVLTGAQVGNIVFQTGETARRANIFSGQFTGIDRQHLGYSQYTVTTSDFNGLWYDGYVDALRNSIVAEEKAVEENVGPITLGITQVLQASIYGNLTSLYGDIPFDEAVNESVSDPIYEDQISVYSKIQLLLDSAIDNLNQNQGKPANGSDIYFDGHANAWLECAYTLKARFYMHTKEYQNAYTAAQNGISSMTNSMYAPHGTAAENSNLNYQFFAVEVRQSDLIVSDFMAHLIDATKPEYRGNIKTDERGRYNFYFKANSNGIQPNTVDGYAAQDANAPLVTYEENLLILAEAGLRTAGFNTGLENLNNFRSFLATGESFSNANSAEIKYEPYEAADFDSGGIENSDGINVEDALLREILEERYISLFGQIESFNDTRRTEGETTVRVPVVPNVGNDLPQRFLYPQTEIDRNSNTPKPLPNFFDKTTVNL